MLQWRNFYLIRFFRFRKWLATLVLVFFLINLAANLIKPTQITPIYNWNLYSYPLPAKDTFSFISVNYNQGKTLSFKRTWNEPQKVLFTNTLNLFVAIEIERKEDYSKIHFDKVWLPQHTAFREMFPQFKNFPGKNELKHFPSWYKRYLQQYIDGTVDSIQVYKKQVMFNEFGTPVEIASHLIYVIK